MSITYTKRDIHLDGEVIGIMFTQQKGCPNLAALYNMSCVLRYISLHGVIGPVPESRLRDSIRDIAQHNFNNLSEPSADDKKVIPLIDQLRHSFSLEPRMSGHTNFKDNVSLRLCRMLGLKVFHCCVLDPEASNYEDIYNFTPAELANYSNTLQGQSRDLKSYRKLLTDSDSQMTKYGLKNLPDQLDDGEYGLIFCRNKLGIICKHSDILFMLQTEDEIYNKLPDALWIFLEEQAGSEIYFTKDFEPVKSQPNEQKALEYHSKYIDEAGKRNAERIAEKNKRKKQKRREKRQILQEEKSCETVVTQGDSSEAVVMGPTGHPDEEIDGQTVSAPGSSEAVGTQGDSSEAVVMGPTGHPAEEIDGQTVSGHGWEIGSAGVSRSDVVDASLHDESELTGVCSTFLSFLIDFKDDGCSEPYFKANLAAFASQSPNFYVPYHFIVAHDEGLALTIQDSYSRIADDLKKSVERYLSMNAVAFSDLNLKIIGLPEPESVQSFVDFLASIDLLEHFEISDTDNEALPSDDGRRMVLGYIQYIVAKFRSGRTWAGQWSETDMKVRNNDQFFIDFKKDHPLQATYAFMDLHKFSTIVLDKFRYNGRLPPYLDHFGDDIMSADECFGDPIKWERFLRLISYPLGLKPPLVRAAFIRNIYAVANAGSVGNPPIFKPLNVRRGCIAWRDAALNEELAKKVYQFQNHLRSRSGKSLGHIWSETHWHLFMFSQHFLEHAVDHIKAAGLCLKINDISVFELLLSRILSRAISSSIRYLVLHFGANTAFFSAWRHYAGSEYVDKPDMDVEDEPFDDMLQNFVDSTSNDKKSGYMRSEVLVYSEPDHTSIIFGDAEFSHLRSQLNDHGFKCRLLIKTS